MQRPSSSRATSIVAKLGAKAASRFEATSSAERASMTVRRSRRPDATISAGPAKAASTPGMVTIKPAVPSLTLRPVLMSVRMPIGRNSVVTMENVPTAMEPTASHADVEVSVLFGGDSASAHVVQGVDMQVVSPRTRPGTRRANEDQRFRSANNRLELAPMAHQAMGELVHEHPLHALAQDVAREDCLHFVDAQLLVELLLHRLRLAGDPYLQ